MTKTEKTGIVLVILGIFATALFIFTAKAPVASATGPFYTNLSYVATSTANVSVTNSTVLAGTTSSGIAPSYTRIFASICNPNANPVYIYLGAGAPASSTAYTTVIAAAAGYNACYQITDVNTYNGAITASSTNQTATAVEVQQFVQ